MSKKIEVNASVVSWRVENVNVRKHDMPAFIIHNVYYSWRKHANRAYIDFPSIISDFNKYKLKWCEVSKDNKIIVASKTQRLKLIYPKTTLSPVTIKN